MSEILFYYTPVAPTTWAYLSSLLMLGLFFKFNRFWSVRNLDLVLLILLAPGLLLEHFGREQEALQRRPAVAEAPATTPARANAGPGGPGAAALGGAAQADGSGSAGVNPAISGRSLRFVGYLWLFAVSAVLLMRMLLDPSMVRRPLLEPNLSPGGLAFIGCSLFVFLMANIITKHPTDDDLAGPRSAARLLRGQVVKTERGRFFENGPGNAFLHVLPTIPTMPLKKDPAASVKEVAYVTEAKTMAILSHLAVVIGITAIGYRHFANIKMGLGAATLYLMLPYTAQMTGRVPHVLPAALLVWAILCYPRPLTAGMFIGMAVGVVYYPIFLLPLWISFYWQRGLMRFLTGVAAMLAFNALLLVFISADAADYAEKLRGMLGIWTPRLAGLDGIWNLGWAPVFRIPIITAFVLLSLGFAIWPARKNLGTLISCSAALMIGTQFWHGNGGGLYMAWFLPMILLTIFRPNLEDRVALTVLGEGWFERRRRSFPSVDRAA